jgi:hypothetical protein
MIGRQYMDDWVTILVSGTYYHYHYIVLVLLLVRSLCWHPQPRKVVDGACQRNSNNRDRILNPASLLSPQ